MTAAVVILLLLQFRAAFGFAVADVVNFVKSNTAQSVSIECPEHARICKTLFTQFAKYSLTPVRLQGTEEALERDLTVYVVTEVKADLTKTFQDIANGKVRTSLAIFPRILQDSDWFNIRETLACIRQNSHFYIASGVHQPLSWHRVITLNNQTDMAISEVIFLPGTLVMEEVYDLQGMTIKSIAKTWPPYLGFEDDLDSSGFLMDVITGIGQVFNFTVVSVQSQDGWGVTPVNGPHNLSGTWTGVMGDVINGKYPLSLSAWSHIIQRHDIVDFVPLASSTKMELFLTPKPAEFDSSLFARPFRVEVWRVFLGVVTIIAATYLTLHMMVHDFKKTNASKLMSIVASFFFVLTNAYYGGALKMFFTTEVTIPFENIRGVIRSSDWKLLMKKGNEVHYQYQVYHGDPDFVRHWERVHGNPDDMIFTEISEGLRRVRDERVVIHVDEMQIRGFFKDNPFYHQELKVLSDARSDYFALILTKNSPLTPVLNRGMWLLKESGMLEQMTNAWMGAKIRSAASFVTAHILSSGQVSMPFLVLSSAMLMSGILLVYECLLSIRQVRSQTPVDA